MGRPARLVAGAVSTRGHTVDEGIRPETTFQSEERTMDAILGLQTLDSTQEEELIPTITTTTTTVTLTMSTFSNECSTWSIAC
jgi:hypothetical protein